MGIDWIFNLVKVRGDLRGWKRWFEIENGGIKVFLGVLVVVFGRRERRRSGIVAIFWGVLGEIELGQL